MDWYTDKEIEGIYLVMSITFEIQNDTKSLEGEWNELLKRINNSEIFFTYEWANCYIKYYIEDRDTEICIVTGRENEKLVCIFPFSYTNKTINFLTSETTDYNSYYVDCSYNIYQITEKAITYLINQREVNKICLTNMPASEEVYILETILRTLGYTSFLEESIICPYFTYKNDCKKIVKKQIKDIERREKRLQEIATLEFDTCNELTDKDWKFISINREKKYGTNALNKPNSKAFYKELANEMKDRFVIDKLLIDGESAAVHMGFITRNKVYYYIPVYDFKYSKYGVGMILLKHLIEDNSEKIFDFLKGDEMYKFNWCSHASMNFHLLAYKKDSSGFIPTTVMKLKNNRVVRSILGR